MGKLWEKVYWFLILIGVLGFVAFKIHGFHGQYQSYEFRTEIRMEDLDDYIYPEVKICSIDIQKKKRSEVCHNNRSMPHSPCGKSYLSIRDGSKGIHNRKDYFKPRSCVTMNSSDLVVYDFIFAKVDREFTVTVEGLKTEQTTQNTKPGGIVLPGVGTPSEVKGLKTDETTKPHRT